MKSAVYIGRGKVLYNNPTFYYKLSPVLVIRQPIYSCKGS